MANPTVEEILNMKTYQLKEYLEDKHVPVPKKQSKEFLQTAALHTHADLEAEAAKKRIITRRRSKREETDVSSTYSGMYGRSTSSPRSPPARSFPSPRTLSMTTRSKASAQGKVGPQSPNRKQEQEATVTAPSFHQEDDISYTSYSALLQSATPSSPSPENILSSVNVNQQIDTSGENRQAAATPPPKQTHIEPETRTESAAYAKLVTRAPQGNPDHMAVPQLEVIKDSIKASDHHESNKSRPYQEVVKKIIRVSDEADHPEKHKSTKKHSGHGDQHVHARSEGSRMQRLKRSGSMIMSQMNERVIKRLRKVPDHCRLHLARPSPHVSIALLMCAVCVAAIGATSYWYHLKKLEEQRARKRWLW